MVAFLKVNTRSKFSIKQLKEAKNVLFIIIFLQCSLRQSPPHEFSVKMAGLERYRAAVRLHLSIVIDAAC